MAAEERERLESALTRRWLDLRDHLDERSRRLWLAAEARSLGYGGTAFVAAGAKGAQETNSAGVKGLAGQAGGPRGGGRAGAGRRASGPEGPGGPGGAVAA